MFARLLKDSFQLSALVRALVGEPEKHPDEPAVLTASIPVRIGGMRSGSKLEAKREGRGSVSRDGGVGNETLLTPVQVFKERTRDRENPWSKI